MNSRSYRMNREWRGQNIRSDLRTSNQHSRPTTSKEILYGRVATYQPKKFGFITPDQGGKDVFFSSKALPEHLRGIITPGTQLRFVRSIDPNGKPCASEIGQPNNGRPSTPLHFETPNATQPNPTPTYRPRPKLVPVASYRPGPKLIPKKSVPAPLKKTASPSSATPLAPRAKKAVLISPSLEEDESINFSNLQKNAPIKLPGSDVPGFDWVKIPDDNGETPGVAYPGSPGSLRSDFSGYTFPPDEDEQAENETENGEMGRHEMNSVGMTPESPAYESTTTPRTPICDWTTNSLEFESETEKFTRNGKAKSTIPCRYHGSARGCSKQESCLYSHEKPWAIRLCDAVSYNAECEYGDECRFRHKRLPEDAHQPTKARKTRRNRPAGPKQGSMVQLRNLRNQQTFNEQQNELLNTPKATSFKLRTPPTSRVDEKEECIIPHNHLKAKHKASWGDHCDPQKEQNFARSFDFEEHPRREENEKPKHPSWWIPGNESPPPRDQIKKFGLRSWHSNGSSSSRS